MAAKETPGNALREARDVIEAVSVQLGRRAAGQLSAVPPATRAALKADALQELMRKLNSAASQDDDKSIPGAWGAIAGALRAAAEELEAQALAGVAVEPVPAAPAEAGPSSDVDMDIESDTSKGAGAGGDLPPVPAAAAAAPSGALVQIQAAEYTSEVPAGLYPPQEATLYAPPAPPLPPEQSAEPLVEHGPGSKAAEATVSKVKQPSGGKADKTIGKRKFAGKGAASLISKWQAVQQEMREDGGAIDSDDSDGVARAAAAERRRAREAEDWRLAQLRAGVSTENANFAVRVSQ